MRIIVKVREKLPVDEYTAKMIGQVESRIEDITFVRTAEFDPKMMKVYVQYEDPEATPEDNRADSVDKAAFRNAINLTKWFMFVGMNI